jgi:hypothetical protein
MVDFYMAFEAVIQQYFDNIFQHFMTRGAMNKSASDKACRISSRGRLDDWHSLQQLATLR